MPNHALRRPAIAVGVRRSNVMAFVLIVRSAQLLGSNAGRATSSVDVRFPEATRNLWRKGSECWRQRRGSSENCSTTRTKASLYSLTSNLNRSHKRTWNLVNDPMLQWRRADLPKKLERHRRGPVEARCRSRHVRVQQKHRNRSCHLRTISSHGLRLTKAPTIPANSVKLHLLL